MKSIICTSIIYFSFAIHITAINTIDSLRQSLSEQVGRDKLETLYLIMSTSEGDEFSKIEMLKTEAIKQRDYLYEASAYQFMAYRYLYIAYDMDSTKVCIDKGFDALEQVVPSRITDPSDQAMYDKIKIWLNHFHVLTHIGRQEETKAVKQIEYFMEANKDNSNPLYREFSYHQMGIIQGFLGNGQGAVDSYLKSLENSAYDTSILELIFRFDTYNQLVDSYGLMEDFDNTMIWCDTIVSTMSKYEDAFRYRSVERMNILFEAYRYYAYSYIMKNDMQKAKTYIEKCDESFPYLVEQYIPMYYDIKAYYYRKIKNYKEANQLIDKAIELTNKNISNSRSLYFLLLKTKILREWGKSDEAFDLLSNLYEINDSINVQDMEGRIAALEARYEVKDLETELKLQEADLNTFRSIIVGAAISIGLMVLILLMIVKHNKSLLEKNRDLFNQHKKTQQLLKSQQSHNLREISDPQEVIVNKLDVFMKSSNIFLNPDLKRDELALEVGTNRQYLIDAIREKKNQTFNEYLYSLRLEYIYNRIENEKDISIAEVFSSSGFTSRAVFNREFKKEYGMTPSELQTIIRENNI